MTEIDLSFETPDYSAEPVAPGGGQRKTKRVFPSLTVPDNKALAKALEVGQEITATVRLRVSEIALRERADDKKAEWDYPGESVRVEFEVQSISPQGVAVKEDDGQKDGKSAIRDFFNKKKRGDSGDEEE